jgi:hypothetical protein
LGPKKSRFLGLPPPPPKKKIDRVMDLPPSPDPPQKTTKYKPNIKTGTSVILCTRHGKWAWARGDQEMGAGEGGLERGAGEGGAGEGGWRGGEGKVLNIALWYIKIKI